MNDFLLKVISLGVIHVLQTRLQHLIQAGLGRVIQCAAIGFGDTVHTTYCCVNGINSFHLGIKQFLVFFRLHIDTSGLIQQISTIGIQNFAELEEVHQGFLFYSFVITLAELTM